MRQIVTLRVAKTASATKSYSLGVPVEVAKILEAADKTTFQLELTEDGVLYRPVETTDAAPDTLPTWLRSASEESAESADNAADAPTGSSQGATHQTARIVRTTTKKAEEA
jgi:hypothetical protein